MYFIVCYTLSECISRISLYGLEPSRELAIYSKGRECTILNHKSIMESILNYLTIDNSVYKQNRSSLTQVIPLASTTYSSAWGVFTWAGIYRKDP